MPFECSDELRTCEGNSNHAAATILHPAMHKHDMCSSNNTIYTIVHASKNGCISTQGIQSSGNIHA